MNRSPLFRPAKLAAALASTLTMVATMSVALPAAASADLAYTGGEALPPELEARLHAPSATMSRDQVQHELEEAQQAGLLPAAGELADRAAVLDARVAFNEHQTRTTLAAWEQERQRLAAAEAQQASQQLAQAPTDGAPAEAGPGPVDGTPGEPLLSDPASAGERPDDPLFESLAGAPFEAPAEEPMSPLELPADEDPMPATLPAEIPIIRPTDLPPGTVIDTE